MLRRLWEHASFRLCLIVWSFGFVLVLISMAAQGRVTSPLVMPSVIPLLLLGVALSMSLAWLLARIERANALAKIGVLLPAVAAAGAVQTFADDAWNRLLALTVFPEWQTWALDATAAELTMVYILYTWTIALSLALVWAAWSTDAARLNEARAAAFEAAASRAEAAALRLQLNPHFLFNTLNGIASLVVRRKSGQAEEMIGRLADFLRSSLAADPTALIPLDQELATVRAYLHIEEARFGDRMRVSWRIGEEVRRAPVPNFLLQPLIENAIKYGVARARRGAEIEIAASREGGLLRLSVVNRDFGAPGGDPAPAPESGGIGLSNTRQRLESLYGEAAAVRTQPLPGGYRCDIALPLEAEAMAAA